MKSIFSRCLFGQSLLSAGVGAAALTTLLVTAVGCNSTPTETGSDGGVQDQGGNNGDLPGSVGGFALTELIPSSGPAAGGNTVTIVGTGFTTGTTVTFGTTPATSVQVLSSIQLTAVAPASPGINGPVSITLKNPDGTTIARGDLYSYYRIKVAFQPFITAPVGTNPVALVTADINSDGFPDLITANQKSNNVTVLTNNQAWNNNVAYPTATGPTALVAADFNFNGRPDVAVACSNATTDDVSVLIDNGGIGFMAPVNFAVAANLVGIDARDLNGDGKIDFVAASRSTGQAYVRLNNSLAMTPDFTAGSTLTLGSQPSGILLSDLDGDGKDDIIATSYGDASVSTFLGLGNATFGAAKVTPTSTQPIALAVGDVNKDGKADVLTTSFNTKQVSVLLSKGDGTFPTLRNLQVGNKPMSIAITDMDGDGNRDIVLVNSGDDTVSVLLGKADGTFDPVQSFTVGSQPVAVIVVDLNKDGKPDIATANFNSNDVTIMLNQIQ